MSEDPESDDSESEDSEAEDSESEDSASEDSEGDVRGVLAWEIEVEEFEFEISAAELSSVLEIVPVKPSPLTKKP